MDYDEFKTLTVAYLEELYAFAVRLTGSPCDGEDLVHTAYVQAFRNWRHLRDPAALRSWLFRILRNVHINQRQRAARSPILELVSGDDLLDREPSSNTRVDEEALANLADSEVEACLARLPRSAQEVVLLADLWGFSYQEAAHILGCPVGTVRSRLHRARRRLASLLEDQTRRTARPPGGPVVPRSVRHKRAP